MKDVYLLIWKYLPKGWETAQKALQGWGICEHHFLHSPSIVIVWKRERSRYSSQVSRATSVYHGSLTHTSSSCSAKTTPAWCISGHPCPIPTPAPAKAIPAWHRLGTAGPAPAPAPASLPKPTATHSLHRGHSYLRPLLQAQERLSVLPNS